MKTAFVDKGYPVILGEFGAIRRSTLTGNALQHHLASRAYYLRYIAEQAKNYGLVPFWYNGSGIFNRSDGSVSDEQALDAFLAGASAGAYPF
jgi:endoglucanase